ncbi:hypothetical protein BX600DRAFT_464928, partial [Xylariales sp. PMI_506]
MNRNILCNFSAFSGDWRLSNAHTCAEPQSRRQSTPVRASSPSQTQPLSWADEYATINSLTELVTGFQGQIQSLAAQVRQNVNAKSSVNPPTPATTQARLGPNENSESRPEIACKNPFIATQGRTVTTTEKRSSSVTHNTFYGPTCPDYSLNMAQLRLRQGGFSSISHESPNLASTGFGFLEDEEGTIGGVIGLTGRTRLAPSNHAAKQRLLHFRNLFSLQEAVRLLFAFQEVVGEYHPIIIIDQLVQQVENCYSITNAYIYAGRDLPDEDSLLIINIILSIALCAESNYPGSETSDQAKFLYLGCREMISEKITWSTPSVKQVIIIVLVGMLHFFQDKVRYAWRMVGIAGRNIMELGLHDHEVARHTLHSKQQWTEHAVLITSIATLDRQWSAATGLPTHFENSHFDQNLRFLAGNPYLKAMATFILMSDKFSEPISRVALGETYEDDDEFDIMNFQIEQWRQKSVGNFEISQIHSDKSDSASLSAWVVLLHLRAKAIRVLLLRPFFLFNTPAAASRRNTQPALDLIKENIDTLCALDRTTDIYRKHHAWFQHILASTSALLFLVIAYVEQNRSSLLQELQDGLLDSVAASFRNAFGLAATYSNSSIASRRLWKRMMQMKKMLVEVGTLPAEDMEEGRRRCHKHNESVQEPLGKDDAMNLKAMSTRDCGNDIIRTSEDLEPALIDLDLFSAIQSSPSDSTPGVGTQGFSVEWAASLSESWQFNNGNGLFLGF